MPIFGGGLVLDSFNLFVQLLPVLKYFHIGGVFQFFYSD